MRASLITLIVVIVVAAAAILGIVSAMPREAVHDYLAPIPAPTVVAQPDAAPTPDAAPVVDPHWLAQTSARTGVPEFALSAYASADLVIDASDPACNLGWNTLAALGTIESANGTVNGGSLVDNGDAVPVIVGPTLDGSPYAAVADTDDGAFDGDTVWDRAVGPLQFLPATWAEYGADANGDGIANPNNIFDASLGAGLYLCATAGDVSNASSWSAAIRAYNPNDTYLSRVRDLAISYAG